MACLQSTRTAIGTMEPIEHLFMECSNNTTLLNQCLLSCSGKRIINTGCYNNIVLASFVRYMIAKCLLRTRTACFPLTQNISWINVHLTMRMLVCNCYCLGSVHVFHISVIIMISWVTRYCLNSFHENIHFRHCMTYTVLIRRKTS